MSVVLLSLVILIALGLAEAWRLKRDRSQIPLRIHVNGIRGKSTITRLIAAGLREAGIQTVAKTTGSAPRKILEDGSEVPIIRRGKPNVKEQMRFLGWAAARNAEAVVIECMAVNPVLQWLCEHRMLRATHTVIANVRYDHQDVMGESLEEIARSLCNTVPTNGVLITAEKAMLPFLQEAAARRGTRVVSVQSETEVTDQQLHGFAYLIYKENLAIALAVCELLGVDRCTALRGARKAAPDPGALQTYEFGEGAMRFVSAFAANEPESTLQVWDRIGLQPSSRSPVVVLVNCRADRIQRTAQFGDELHRFPCDRVVLVGHFTSLCRRRALAAGVPSEKIISLGNANLASVLRHLAREYAAGSIVVGMGNIGGVGRELVEYCERQHAVAKA